MTDQNKEISTPFTEVVTNKIQKQSEQISAIEKKLETIEGNSPVLQEIKKQLTEIKVGIIAIKFPTKQMDELSGQLVTSVALLKQPVENKVIHHHHVHKIILISAGLFILLCLACCGWYNTSQILDWHTANDFKYRYVILKLKTIHLYRNYFYIQTAYIKITQASTTKCCMVKTLFISCYSI